MVNFTTAVRLHMAKQTVGLRKHPKFQKNQSYTQEPTMAKKSRWRQEQKRDPSGCCIQTMCAVCIDDQEFCLKTWPTDQLAVSVLNTSAEEQPRPRASLRADAAGASATMVKAAATDETEAAAATTLRDVPRKSAPKTWKIGMARREVLVPVSHDNLRDHRLVSGMVTKASSSISRRRETLPSL